MAEYITDVHLHRR